MSRRQRQLSVPNQYEFDRVLTDKAWRFHILIGFIYGYASNRRGREEEEGAFPGVGHSRLENMNV